MSRYYDLILGLIPLALFGVAGTLSVFGLTLNVAFSVAAMIALLLVGHALFVNTPVSAPRPATRDATEERGNQSSQVGPINAD